MWRKPLATDKEGGFLDLAAWETNVNECEVEFLLEISRQGYIRL